MPQGDFFSLLERPVAAPPPLPVELLTPAIIRPEDCTAGRYPQRLMRSRKKGARLPKSAIWCGRGTILCNPFRFERFGHARSVLMYMNWMECRLSDLKLERAGFCASEIDALHRLREKVQRRLPMIARRDLVCWCPLTSRFCHANTLIEHANEDLPKGFRFEPPPAVIRPHRLDLN